MADFPSSQFVPRTTENLPGIVYDATKTREVFAEDYSFLAAEIAAIEAALGVPFAGVVPYSGATAPLELGVEPLVVAVIQRIANSNNYGIDVSNGDLLNGDGVPVFNWVSLVFKDANSLKGAAIDTSALTDDRVLALPDASGTLALAGAGGGLAASWFIS